MMSYRSSDILLVFHSNYTFLFYSVCVSARISQKPRDQTSQNVLYISPVVVARSSFDYSATSYLLPVLWMTSRYGNYEFKRMPVVGPSTAKLPLVGGSVVAHYFLQWRHADDVFILVTCSMRYKSRGAKFAVCDCFVLAIENYHFWKCNIFHLRYNWQRKGSYALTRINLYCTI